MQASLAEAHEQLTGAQQELSAQQAQVNAQSAKVGELQEHAATQNDTMQKAAQDASERQQELTATIDTLQVRRNCY